MAHAYKSRKVFKMQTHARCHDHDYGRREGSHHCSQSDNNWTRTVTFHFCMCQSTNIQVRLMKKYSRSKGASEVSS